MKATLTFDLPEDNWDLKKAIAGAELHISIEHFRNILKSKAKHEDDCGMYEEILELLNENLPASFFDE